MFQLGQRETAFDIISLPWRPSGGVPLRDATLGVHSQRVDVPTYDRSALGRGVVHIGAGNFHRAHQAVYFDDLARKGISDQWGVTGVSLRSRDVKDLLSAQDGLYTVVQRGHDRQMARVVGSIGSVHYAPNDGAAVRAALGDEIQPLLPPVPGMNTPEYRASVLDRLSNPRMSDQLSRLARRGTSKIAQFVLPSLQEAIAQGRPHTLLMLAVAGWARYMRGRDLKDRKISLEDSQAIPVVKLATMATSNPDPLLGHEMFTEVRAVPGFAERLSDMIADIDEHGVVPTLRDAMRNGERELVSR